MFVLPINTDGYVGRRPYVLLALVALNTLALVITYLCPTPVHDIFLQYGFVPGTPHISTAISSMFLHAGFWHFAGNMFFLWMFGYRVENAFGPWLFGIVYILSGFGATALDFAFNGGSSIPCVGASGAISGIVGCYFVLFPKSQFDLLIVFLRWPVKTIHTYTHGAVGAWIGEQAVLGLLTQAAQFSSVAFWGHVGGFVAGAALTGLLLLVVPQIRERGEQPIITRYVRGAVHDTSGKPVVGARFELQGDSHSTFSASTDARGRFGFASVPDGSYSFRVLKLPFRSIEGTLVVRRKRSSQPPLRFVMKMAEVQTAIQKADAASV